MNGDCPAWARVPRLPAVDRSALLSTSCPALRWPKARAGIIQLVVNVPIVGRRPGGVTWTWVWGIDKRVGDVELVTAGQRESFGRL